MEGRQRLASLTTQANGSARSSPNILQNVMLLQQMLFSFSRCSSSCSRCCSDAVQKLYMLWPLTHRDSFNAMLLQDMIVKIHDRQMDLEDVMVYMCSSRVDSYLVHLLRAITANELWRKQDHYKTFIPGIDAYGSVLYPALTASM